MALTIVDKNMYEGAGVATLQELILNQNIAAGEYISTRGYYEEGDGGAGTYLIAPDNTGDGYVDHNVGAFTAVLQHNGEIFIKQAGVVGDGVTNDAAAIGAALQAASNGTLTFENSKEYLIDDVIGKVDGDTIRINGKGSKLLVKGLTPEQLAIEGDASRGWWYLSVMLHLNCANVTVRDLHIDCQNTFVYQTFMITGKANVMNMSIRNIRYPNGTFSNQWPTSNEAAFITVGGVGSQITDVTVEDTFYQWFDGTLTEPNSRAEFQGRAFAINGNNTNHRCTYNSIKLNRVSMGVIIDDGTYLTFNNMHINEARANAVYELGALTVRYLGCSFENCFDQGISTYGSNILVQGCTFYNITNRPIAIRNSAKTRIVIDGCTFRHQISADCPNMMCIGRADGAGTNHDIGEFILSNNTFDIEMMNYYIAEIGPVSKVFNVTGNTVFYHEAITSRPTLFHWSLAPGAEVIPTIVGNSFDSADNETCRVTVDLPCLIMSNSMRDKVDDQTSAAFSVPPSSLQEVHADGASSRTLEGTLATDNPRGQFDIRSIGEVDGPDKAGYGGFVTFTAEDNIFSPYHYSTMGATGFVFDNDNNEQPTSEYQILIPDANTKLLTKVFSVDRYGRPISHLAGRGVVVSSPNGAKWELKVANDGTLTTTMFTPAS